MRIFQYTRYFAAFCMVAAILAFAFYFSDRARLVFGCRQASIANAFMGVCWSDQFGDYEHAAYYFGTEPDAVEKLRKARVLILGNSRTQFAFSTQATNRYFGERSTSFYLLSFGYGELAAFPLALIRSLNLEPKVLIVNADPFFASSLSEVAGFAAESSTRWQRYVVLADSFVKKWIINLQPVVCKFMDSLCPGKYASLYRERSTGQWIWHTYAPPELVGPPVDSPKKTTREADVSESEVSVARNLISAAGVKAECVVLTQVPNAAFDVSSYVRRMGSRIGAPVALPLVESLATVDGSHLNLASAERWSTSFFHEASGIMEKCLRE